MATIYAIDGTRYEEVPLSFDGMMDILKDDSIIGPNDFIEIHYPDGSQAAIRKKDICGVYQEGSGCD